MSDMTLDDARRIAKNFADGKTNIDRFSHEMAIRVILAALPAPERHPLAKTAIEGERKWCEANGNSHHRPWETFDSMDRDCCEAGAFAVLSEHAVDYVFAKITPRDIQEIWGDFRFIESESDLVPIRAKLLNRVKARLAEVKP